MKSNKTKLTAKECDELLLVLRARFEKNTSRHKGIEWVPVEVKLKASPENLWSLSPMEITGGEPDVIVYNKKLGEYLFYDCSAESPKGRRSVCYDHEALESRKEHKPANSATKMAADMGIELLSEVQYLELQKLGKFDSKTSSWLKTPTDVRKLGGAISGEFRFSRTFIYANGA